ncbi:MAG: hypothetical protein GYB31_06760 [Bacteroidetes bacterium]|nr:hypothetical protein [Bacteroidota bacterium]
MEDPKIDGLFKEGLENRSFDWDHAYWESVEAEIEKRKRKRRGFFLLFFGAGLVLLGAFFIFSRASAELNPQEPHASTSDNETLLETESKTIPEEKASSRGEKTARATERREIKAEKTFDESRQKETFRKSTVKPAANEAVPTNDARENMPDQAGHPPVKTDLSPKAFPLPVVPVPQLRLHPDYVQAFVYSPQGKSDSLFQESTRPDPSKAFQYGVGLSVFGQSGVPESWNTPWFSGWGAHFILAYSPGESDNKAVRFMLEPGVNVRTESFAMLDQSTQTALGLELSETNYRLIPDAVWMGSAPVSAHINLNEKHALKGGLDLAWIFAARGSLETWEYKSPEDRTAEEAADFESAWREAVDEGTAVENLPRFSTLVATEKGWMDMDAFQQFQVAARFGYILSLRTDLRLQLLGRYRFTPYAKDTQLTSAQSRLSLELGINYLLK